MEINILTKEDDNITTRVNVVLFKEDDYWIAYCPPLNLSSYWKTKSEAKDAFTNEMRIFLSETVKKNTLERYLLELGWEKWEAPGNTNTAYKAPARLTDMKKYTNRRTGYEVYEKDVAIPLAA